MKIKLKKYKNLRVLTGDFNYPYTSKCTYFIFMNTYNNSYNLHVYLKIFHYFYIIIYLYAYINEPSRSINYILFVEVDTRHDGMLRLKTK